MEEPSAPSKPNSVAAPKPKFKDGKHNTAAVSSQNLAAGVPSASEVQRYPEISASASASEIGYATASAGFGRTSGEQSGSGMAYSYNT